MARPRGTGMARRPATALELHRAAGTTLAIVLVPTTQTVEEWAQLVYASGLLPEQQWRCNHGPAAALAKQELWESKGIRSHVVRLLTEGT